MTNEWRTANISEVVSVTDYVANGSFESLRNNVKYCDNPEYAVLIRLVDYNAGWNGKFVYVDKASYDFLKKSSLKKGDIVIANVGANAGTVFRVPDLGKPMTLGPNSVLCRAIDEQVLNQDFLFYYLLSGKGQASLRSILSGSAQPKFNKTDLRRLSIHFPSISVQRTIAKILFALDEKIELNHQMNKTLEAIGQALFKRWFVDFEFPGHEKTRVVNGAPDGWHRGNLIEISDLIMGQSPPGDTYNEQGDGVVFYQGNRDFGFRFPTPRVYCTAPTRMAEALDVLISVRAPVGAINITLEKCAIGRGVAALRMKHFSNGFLFYFLSTRSDLWDRFNSEGTVFGCLNKAEFQKVDLVIPSDAVLKQFDSVIKPIEAMIQKNETENRLLVGIRDSLMPKLMSGKIRITCKE